MEDSISFFRPHDLLTENQDFIDIHISSQILRLFEKTRDIECFESMDDIRKALRYGYLELVGLDLAILKELLSERRPTIMEFYYLQSRYSDRA